MPSTVQRKNSRVKRLFFFQTWGMPFPTCPREERVYHFLTSNKIIDPKWSQALLRIEDNPFHCDKHLALAAKFCPLPSYLTIFKIKSDYTNVWDCLTLHVKLTKHISLLTIMSGIGKGSKIQRQLIVVLMHLS